MEWLYYLLEANLYLLLFYGFYKLLLAKTTFYSSNRYYLLLSSLTAFIIPLLQLGTLKPTQIVDDLLFPPPILYSEAELAKIAATPIQQTISFTSFLYPLYLLVACFFAIKLALNIIKIVQLWLTANKKTNGNVTLVELSKEKSAFSFFNLLFIHPHLADTKAVLRHEMVHIKQKHSVDILLFEVIQTICWFNPIIYFLQKDIKLIHEFIADELSTSAELQKHEYAMFLIENSFGVVPTSLTNQIFNQSILKRRINMLNKKRTAGRARLRLLLVLPLSVAMLCTSTIAFTKDYGYLDLLPKQADFQEPMTKANTDLEMAKEGRYSPSYIFDKNDKYQSLEKRLIVLNGVPIKDNNKYYGNFKADKIIFLNAKNALAKYGTSAKFGAVEISGRKSVIVFQPEYKIADTANFPRPIVKTNDKIKPPIPPAPPQSRKPLAPARNQTQVKFTSPVEDKFFPMRSVNIDGEINSVDQRFIVINGKRISDINTFFGVTNATKIVSLNGKNAIKKYGVVAKYGAIEITGRELKYVKSIADGPPPPIMTQVKFPPPIVKPEPTIQKRFSPRSELKHDGKAYIIVKPDPRYIVINGTPVADMYKFYGVMNTESVTILTPSQAMKVYGNKNGKSGAVEIKGSAIKFVPGLVGSPLSSMSLALNRNKGDLLKIPKTTDELKTLTVYNSSGNVIYNSTDYNDDWNGETGNYKEFSNQRITPNTYSFLVKISDKQFSNIRGKVIIK